MSQYKLVTVIYITENHSKQKSQMELSQTSYFLQWWWWHCRPSHGAGAWLVKGTFNEKCSQGFRHMNIWSTVVMLFLEAEEVQCTGGSRSLGIGFESIPSCPASFGSFCWFEFVTKMWSLSLLFLRSCFPAKMDTYSSGTISQNKFSSRSCFWSFFFSQQQKRKK